MISDGACQVLRPPDASTLSTGELLSYVRWAVDAFASATGGFDAMAGDAALDAVASLWAGDPAAPDRLRAWFTEAVPRFSVRGGAVVVPGSAWEAFDASRERLTVAVFLHALDAGRDPRVFHRLGYLVNAACSPGADAEVMVTTAALADPRVFAPATAALGDVGLAWPRCAAGALDQAARTLQHGFATASWLKPGDVPGGIDPLFAGVDTAADRDVLRAEALRRIGHAAGPDLLSAAPVARLGEVDAAVLLELVDPDGATPPLAAEVFAHLVAGGDTLTVGAAWDAARAAERRA